MKRFRVALTNGVEIIEVADHVTPEGWWAAARQDDGNFVTLNETRYLKANIIEVMEEKSRHGFTNLEGV